MAVPDAEELPNQLWHLPPPGYVYVKSVTFLTGISLPGSQERPVKHLLRQADGAQLPDSPPGTHLSQPHSLGRRHVLSVHRPLCPTPAWLSW